MVWSLAYLMLMYIGKNAPNSEKELENTPNALGSTHTQWLKAIINISVHGQTSVMLLNAIQACIKKLQKYTYNISNAATAQHAT